MNAKKLLVLLLVALALLGARCEEGHAHGEEEHAHDHDHGDHAHDHAGHDHGVSVAGSAAAPSEEEHAHDDHAHDHAGHDHGVSVASNAAVPTEEEHAHDHDHDDHAHGSHAGHNHGISVADYAAALARGEDPCAAEELLNYNLSLNIASVFILLAVSLAGSLGPVALNRLAGRAKAGAHASTIVSTAITLGSLFGCGTILATALIHMALPAVMALTSPCLKVAGWDKYEAWPYLFILIAILVTQAVDALIRGYFIRRHAASGAQQQAHQGLPPTGGCGHTMLIGAMTAPAGPVPHAHDHDNSSSQKGSKDEEAGEAGPQGGACAVHGEGCNSLLGHTEEPERASRTLGIWLADAGIIFHSVMIGLTLGVTSGTAFNTLLAALSFHQFFEGLALGSAAIQAGLATGKTLLVGLTYSISTPTGIAIGIGIRESFNANATSTLLATGILDALSTGILLYVALVQLITPLLTDSTWVHSRRWPMQVVAFASFYAGATVMAVIGKWA